jgi:hypothetical protein
VGVSREHLAGNGALLVRERALAGRVQRALEALYQLDRVADVHDFVTAATAEDGEGREALLVREPGDGTLEVSLRLPELGDEGRLDPLCQIIEGVSHFVYLTERAQAEQSTTHLELEIQAEVDKYVVLAASVRDLDARASAQLRARLYEGATYAHDEASEIGARYRLANDAAHAFVARLERMHLATRSFGALRSELRRFFRAGQEEKLRAARA